MTYDSEKRKKRYLRDKDKEDARNKAWCEANRDKTNARRKAVYKMKRLRSLPERLTPDKVCKNCGVLFAGPAHKRFCNKRCRRRYARIHAAPEEKRKSLEKVLQWRKQHPDRAREAAKKFLRVPKRRVPYKPDGYEAECLEALG